MCIAYDPDSIASIWRGNDRTWRHSNLIRSLRKTALAEYSPVTTRNGAAWNRDRNAVASNMTFFFPGNVLCMQNALSFILGDEESHQFLETTGELTILDLACGPATASIATVDFLVQLLRHRLLERRSALRVNFILHDLHAASIRAAERNIAILRRLLSGSFSEVQVGNVQSSIGSISEIMPVLNTSSPKRFEVMILANAFDQILIHGDAVLEEDPTSTDALAHARPCDRPHLLAELIDSIGAYANPFFSRALLLQESRYANLIPLCLSLSDLEVTRTSIAQATVRPDIEQPTFYSPFGFCGFCYRYGANGANAPNRPTARPLDILEGRASFSERNNSEFEGAALFAS